MMKALTLSWQYIAWHYSRAFVDMVHLIGRAYWFQWHFFSIGILFRSFFEPWKRLGEEKGEKFQFDQWLQATVINTLMRLIGMSARAVILVFALLVAVASTLVMVLFAAAWCVLPLLIVSLLVKGVVLLVP